MMLSLLHARRENKVKDPSIAHTKLAKMATAAKRRVIRSLMSVMTTKMRIAMTLNKLRRREDAVVNAEAAEAMVVDVVDSTVVMMIMKIAEVAIDPDLLFMMMKNQRLLKALRSRQQLLHLRRKKLRLRSLPKNSLAGRLLFSDDIADTDHHQPSILF